ncbi:MAG: hypothetical protein U1C55_07810 [Smithellaceae bacterium]|nr:hypothetical protein [Smithellaceae bacterium]
MKKIIFAAALAGMIIALSAIPAVIQARQGQGAMTGQALQTQTKSGDQTQVKSGQRTQERKHLRDGSGANGGGVKSGVTEKRDKAYGPNDGSGKAGVRPQDGTGYGAPANR